MPSAPPRRFEHAVNSTVTGVFSDDDASVQCLSPPLNAMVLTDVPDKEGWLFHVQVALNGQQYASTGQNFTYYASPVTLATMNPPLGPMAGGTVLTITGSLFVNTGSTFCYIYSEDDGDVYDSWMEMPLQNESLASCVMSTWEVPEPVSFYIALNKYDLFGNMSFLFYEVPALTNCIPDVGPATGVLPDGGSLEFVVTTDEVRKHRRHLGLQSVCLTICLRGCACLTPGFLRDDVPILGEPSTIQPGYSAPGSNRDLPGGGASNRLTPMGYEH
jgi:hypothetical protein